MYYINFLLETRKGNFSESHYSSRRNTSASKSRASNNSAKIVKPVERFCHCICRKGKLHEAHVHSQHSLCGHVICVLWTVLSTLVFAPVVALLAFLGFFFFFCVSYMYHNILSLFLPDKGNFKIFPQTPCL